jgi:hypothetical protein
MAKRKRKVNEKEALNNVVNAAMELYDEEQKDFKKRNTQAKHKKLMKACSIFAIFLDAEEHEEVTYVLV